MRSAVERLSRSFDECRSGGTPHFAYCPTTMQSDHVNQGEVAGVDRSRLERMRRREDATFRQRTAASERLGRRARLVMPSGVPMAWMAGLYRHHPMFVVAGEGCHFVDADGHTYLDMNQADLSASCGFSPQPVVDAVVAQAKRGLQFLLPVEAAIDVAELLAARYGLSHWQFTLSASTANVEALRLARLATARTKVLMFAGHYHGHWDEALVDGTERETHAELLGLTPSAAAETVIAPFNDLETVARLLANHDVAAVLTEPALTNVGVVQPDPDFHQGLRELCTRQGTLLIVDETHTQMAAWGGLTRAWSLQPDLLTLGKSVGGGVPLGAYGMTPQLAEFMDRHRDDDAGEAGLATGGTTYANPLSLVAARAALGEVMTVDAYAHAQRLGGKLADGIDAAAKRHRLPWRAHRLGGRSGYCLEAELPRTAQEAERSLDVDLIDTRRVYLANRGIWEAIASAGPAVSFAHDDGDVARYLETLDQFLGELAAGP